MTGRVIIVTGANSGIGFEVARNLCDSGNDVIFACRDPEKGKSAVAKVVKANPNALASFMELDLADLGSVRRFVDEFHASERSLHVLINNAGLFLAAKDPKRYFTSDNFELAMGTNHIGHFLLSSLLLDDLKKTGGETGDSRIVVVTSMLHDGNARNKNLATLNLEDIFLAEAGKYSSNLAYKNSKLATLLFTYELAKKLTGTGISVNAVCPGFIPSTELGRHSSTAAKFFTRYVLDGVLKFTKVTRSTLQGAKAVLHVATDEKLKEVNGKYFRDLVEAESSAESKNEELAQKMWELSARYCHMDGVEPLDAPVPPVEEPEVVATPKSKDKKKAKKEAAATAAVSESKEDVVKAEVKTEEKTEDVRSEGEGQAEVKVEVTDVDEKKTGGGDITEKIETTAPVIELEPETKGKDIEEIVSTDVPVVAQ